MRRSRMEQRKFLNENNCVTTQEISTLLLKLPLLIRTEGLKEALDYLKGKQEKLYKVIKEYIEIAWGKEIEDIKKGNKVEIELQQKIILDIMQLLQEWRYFISNNEKAQSKKYEVHIKDKLLEKKGGSGKINYNARAKNLINKQEGYIEKLKKSNGYEILKMDVKNINRTVIGISEPSITETGMTLHHLYQVPYIPASAIKGVFHHYCENEMNSDEKNKYIEKWFGKEGKKGDIIFLDGYFKNIVLVEDIIAPHYYKYYEGRDIAPNKAGKPIIISFQAVQGGESNLNILIRKDIEAKEVCDLSEHLKRCFDCFYSIGAKRTNGYGFFQVFRKEEG